MDVVIVIALLIVGGWWLSAKLHPYVPCKTCQGKGRHTGNWAKKSGRPCHACSGRGIKQRPAAKFFGIGQVTKSTSRLQPQTRNTAKSGQ